MLRCRLANERKNGHAISVDRRSCRILTAIEVAEVCRLSGANVLYTNLGGNPTETPRITRLLPLQMQPDLNHRYAKGKDEGNGRSVLVELMRSRDV